MAKKKEKKEIKKERKLKAKEEWKLKRISGGRTLPFAGTMFRFDSHFSFLKVFDLFIAHLCGCTRACARRVYVRVFVCVSACVCVALLLRVYVIHYRVFHIK